MHDPTEEALAAAYARLEGEATIGAEPQTGGDEHKQALGVMHQAGVTDPTEEQYAEAKAGCYDAGEGRSSRPRRLPRIPRSG